MKKLLFTSLSLIIFAYGYSQQKEDEESFDVKNLKKYDGFIPFYYDEEKDHIYLEIHQLDSSFLYANSLSAGVGSNDIGLDRGQLGDSRVVYFHKQGNKIMLVQPNLQYRANTANPLEKKSVEEAFAQSILWGFPIKEKGDGYFVADATDFFVRDAHDVQGTLKQTKQGDYKLDMSRSAFYLDRTKNFPKNSEFEVTLTFTGDPQGAYIRSVTPTPQAVTVRQHHSFVQLPDGNYHPREFDPRAGYFGFSYYDYATPISSPIEKRFITRHRLQKKDPAAAKSEPVKPIIYYLDPGTPEPVRSALLEGARWWNQAFEAAGYINAFRVEMLPPDADPMDVRYNVVQWVHRSTRGWSYGASVVDPRTGEIIQGHVTLGSLRVRQDFLIGEGLTAPYKNPGDKADEALKMALARIRQLAAHEVGHTLGLAHNFAASPHNRASVMDYPHPYITVDNKGNLDLSQAYDNKIGDWDKIAIQYGYSDFAPGTNEHKALNNILKSASEKGLIFISDEDARPAGGAHPLAHLWDNGARADEELARVLEIRKVALDHFSTGNIPFGQPMATLEDVLVPIYFFHRYQTEAASKLIGGQYYEYGVKETGEIPEVHPVEIAEQQNALKQVIHTLDPEVLTIPESILKLIPPRPIGYDRNRELVDIKTTLTFDPISAAQTSADMTLEMLLHPSRANRLVIQHASNTRYPGLEEVLDQLFAATWEKQHPNGLAGEVKDEVDFLVLQHTMNLAMDNEAFGEVKAICNRQLELLQQWLSDQVNQKTGHIAHFAEANRLIKAYFTDMKIPDFPQTSEPPAGSPIGETLECGWNYLRPMR